MIFTEFIKIPLKDVENGNVIGDRGLLEIFENVATHHSDSIDDGVNAVNEKKKAWVVLEWKVKVLSRPLYGKTFKVDTWSRENNIQEKKIATYRDFEMYDEQGNLLVIATSKWTLVNINTGRITSIEKELQERYLPEIKSVFDTWDIEKINKPDSSICDTNYIVSREKVDFNLHMHNIYYIDLAYNALPEDVYKLRPFNNFRISYKREIKLGEKVKCKYMYQDKKHIVTVYSIDESKVHSIIVLW